MLRIQGRGAASRANGGFVRGLRTQSRLLQEAKDAASETVQQAAKKKPAKKQTRRFRNFLITTIGFGAGLYGGGVYYSLKDDRFLDFFTEYVPFSERVISYIEEQQFKRRLQSGEQHAELPSRRSTPENIDRLVKVTKAGAEPREHKEPVEDEPKPLIKKTEKKTPEPAAAKPAAKADKAHLPLVHIPSGSDAVVNEAVEKLNQFIQAVNKSAHTEDAVAAISDTLTKLSHSIDALKQQQRAELDQKLAEQAEKIKSESKSREDKALQQMEAMQQEYSKIFQSEQQRIIDLYNQRLLTEIEATKKAVIAHANNRLVAVSAERERQFAEQVAQKVDEEREGRLAKIKELSESVKELQELSLATDEIIKATQNVAEYHAAVSQLHNALGHSEPIALRSHIQRVLAASGDDALVRAAVESIPESVFDEGVLSPAQLAARFRMIEPEIRKASLLPPDAGIAGHFGSWLFSTLLWKKQGNPVGNDVESVIARTETALTEGRVEDAVAEVNSLRGWPKKLAKDWLSEGRKRCEVEFLIKTLGVEGNLRK